MSLDYAAILAYANDHPDDEPEAIGVALTATMTKVQLREYAAADVAAIVDGHRRELARRAEDRARVEPAAPEDEQRAELIERYVADRAERARQVEARLTSEESFQELYDNPLAVIGKTDGYGPHIPLTVGRKFRDWCGDRFDPWFKRTYTSLDEKRESERSFVLADRFWTRCPA